MAGSVAAAMHELRRPLQVAMLALTGSGPAGCALACLEQAAAALELLEHELGLRADPPRPDGARTAARDLLADARLRWPGLAVGALGAGDVGGATPEPGTGAGSPDLELPGDPRTLAAALDNLIANALEHGGGGARVELRRDRDGISLIVGNPPGPTAPGSSAAAGPGRGHGLAIVERTAAELGGLLEGPRRVGPEVISRVRLPAVDGSGR